MRAQEDGPSDKAQVISIYHPARGQVTSNCNIYLAPSPIGGSGVYAGRDFKQYEVVEIAPRFIPMKGEWFKYNVLDDYHYGFTYQAAPDDHSFGVTVLGMTMFYNHGAGTKQNIVFTNFGHEPSKDHPWFSQMKGFAAKRDIKRGEELLSTYGETDAWFIYRGLVMGVPPEEPETPSLEFLEQQEAMYCSKVHAGIGHSTYTHRVLPTQDAVGHATPLHDYIKYLPLQDCPTAVANQNVKAGQLLERAPALVLPSDQVELSPLGPLCIFWSDLDETQQEAIFQLREAGAFRMKGFDHELGGMNLDVLQYYEDAALFPAAGNIGMVRKVGREDETSNCRLEIISSTEDHDLETVDLGSAGLVLKLIATKDIQAGDELRLNVPDSSSWDSRMSLLQHLALTGQPIPQFLADPYNPDVIREEQPPIETEDEL